MKLRYVTLLLVGVFMLTEVYAHATPVPTRTATNTPVVSPTNTPGTPTPPPPTSTPTVEPPTATPTVKPPTNTPTIKQTPSPSPSVTVSATPTSCDSSDEDDEGYQIMAFSVPPLMAAAPPRKNDKRKKYDACVSNCDSLYSNKKNNQACKDACGDFMCKKDSCASSNTGDANGNYISNCKDRCNKNGDYSITERDACINGCNNICGK
jgi:hypothetical protein